MATSSKKRPPLNKVGRSWESIIDGQTSPGPSFDWYGHKFIDFYQPQGWSTCAAGPGGEAGAGAGAGDV